MNWFDVGLSFLEGLALIASPCILPVLPLVLSTSIDGGKARPFGIISGFIVAFSSFVLLSRQIVEALHINTDAIRDFSLVLLSVLGLVLLIDKLSEKFSGWTQGAADFGGKFGANSQGGYVSGLVIGALIGLVWTPCAGPILAAVLVQVIRQQSNLQGVFVTVGFALGAGIPMFIIALTGRKIMRKVGFFAAHAYAVRKTFGVLILASVVYLGFGSVIQASFQPTEQVSMQPVLVSDKTIDHLEKGLETPYPAPDFVGIQAWLNSNPLTMAQLKGKVVLIDFWTYSCINCVRTLPYVTAWDQKYRDQGLVIIGVHAPEFEFEKNIDNIKAALGQHTIQYPVAVDNNLSTWLAYKNRYWPAHYLIDQNGQVVYTHFGEGDYDVTENNIRYLLGLKGKVDAPAAITHAENESQETYLGYARGSHYAGMPAVQRDSTAIYKSVDTLPDHQWDLTGPWKIEGQKITAQSKDATLRLNFTAKKVFLVMGTADGTSEKVRLSLNGHALEARSGKDVEDSTVTVMGHTLYELISQPTAESGILEIKPSAAGFEAYAFTFGS